MRHLPIPEQGRYLRLVLNGFYNYYAVPTNFRALNAFDYHVLSHWLRCLRRRSQRHRLTWRKMMRIAERWLSPKLRYLAARRHNPREEPAALAAHAGIGAGGGEQSRSLPRLFLVKGDVTRRTPGHARKLESGALRLTKGEASAGRVDPQFVVTSLAASEIATRAAAAR